MTSNFLVRGAEILAGVLGQCAALAHLNLSLNRIGSRGAKSLAGVLAQCTALAHLNLRGNDIGNDGAGRLAGVLGKCAALAHLDLQANEIGTAGAESLAGVLAQCTALARLDLRCWRFSRSRMVDWAEWLTESWIGPEGGLKVDWLDSEESDEESDWEDEELMFEVDDEGVYYKR